MPLSSRSIGLLIGNGVGIGLCLLQQNFHLVKLPEESYYVSEAPVLLNAGYILLHQYGDVARVCAHTHYSFLFYYAYKSGESDSLQII